MGNLGCQVLLSHSKSLGVAMPFSTGAAISILGQRLFFLMKTCCFSTAGTEGLLLTPVPVAAQLISDGHKRAEPQLSHGAEQHILTVSLLPPVSAWVANSLLLLGAARAGGTTSPQGLQNGLVAKTAVL